MKLDFSTVIAGTEKLTDLQNRYTHRDLIDATNESIDHVLGLIRQIPDSYVTFQPVDPDAVDPKATSDADRNSAWTLGHVIVHMTASAEEAACLGSLLARGVEVSFRARYETPWESVHSTQQLLDRLEESRRMRLAYLNAWPDQPNLDLLWYKMEARHGPLNAIGYTLYGLKHDADHFAQIAEIVRQARVAEPTLVL